MIKPTIIVSVLFMSLFSTLKPEEGISRKAEFPIDQIFLDRWSPRAMSGQKISDKELMSLFEAARWAPSSYNGQPWRFIYAKKGTKHWNTFFELMVPFNQSWAYNAAALVIIVSADTFSHNGKLSRTHSFDTGAAWQNLALQGSLMGLVVHGMSGFDYDKAKEMLNIPDDYTIEAMFAVGKPGTVKNLSNELRNSEKKSDRKPVQAFVAEGVFKKEIR